MYRKRIHTFIVLETKTKNTLFSHITIVTINVEFDFNGKF